MICTTTGTYAYDPNVKVLWVNSISNVLLPTTSELVTGGVYLNDSPYNLTEIIGWEVNSEVITDPPWGPFAVQRAGGLIVPDAQLILAAARDGNDVRTLLSRGTTGYILILPVGRWEDYPLAPLNVYPVCVVQVSQLQRHRTGSASSLLIKFAVSATVGENVTVV